MGGGTSGDEETLDIGNTTPVLFDAIERLDLQAVTTEQNLKQVNVFGDTPLVLAVASGSPGICAFLLSRGGNPNQSSRFGETALRHACRYGYLDIADLLKDAYDVTPQGQSSSAESRQEGARSVETILEKLR